MRGSGHRRLQYILVAVVIGLAVVMVTSHNDRRTPTYLVNGGVAHEPAREYWHERIERVGPLSAYDEMVRAAQEFSQRGSQHALAHAFGDALYTEIGTEGITLCGNEFASGCVHEIMGQGIEEFGTTVIEKFAAHCASLDPITTRGVNPGVGGCWHGLGHGIGSYAGYEFEELSRSLEACDASAPRGGLLACLDGVLMEYNVREMIADESLWDPRPLGEDPYEPCFRLSGLHRYQCVFQLPYWWSAVASDIPAEERIRQIGERCEGISDTMLERRCFMGIGYIVPGLSNYKPATIRSLCSAASADRTNQLTCLYASALRVAIDDVSMHELVCEQLHLSRSEEADCLSFTSRAWKPPFIQ